MHTWWFLATRYQGINVLFISVHCNVHQAFHVITHTHSFELDTKTPLLFRISGSLIKCYVELDAPTFPRDDTA